MSIESQYLNLVKNGALSQRDDFVKLHSCPHSQFGDSKCYVKLDALNVYVDKCIADEINYLISQGIKTLNSCCGHKILKPSVLVKDESVDKMTKLGYVRVEDSQSEYAEFMLKMSEEEIRKSEVSK